ncbi:MAG: M23 family metallopeptidase [Chloroflexi bacterium]|nr:M23 family metallopeptidase [Chloroflexota bacterium]
MVWVKPLFLLFAPPALNWLVGKLWERYRELRLNRLAFWGWVTAVLPAVFAIVFGIAEAAAEIRQASAGTAVPGEYRLRLSHYNPSLSGVNCDSDCTTMASGDKVAAWVGGQSGVFAAACPRKWGWSHGTRFTVMGAEFECRDTGGWISCYEPGERDKAIANAHERGNLMDQPAIAEEPYCWVDTMTTQPLAPYSELTDDWTLYVNAAPPYTGAQQFLFYAPGTAVNVLDNYPHVSAIDPAVKGDWAGRDFIVACGTKLHNPLPGAKVERKGVDTYGNTYVLLFDGTYYAMFMHGDYNVRDGQRLKLGDVFGQTASHGLSTECHDHVSIRTAGWILIDPLAAFGHG